MIQIRKSNLSFHFIFVLDESGSMQNDFPHVKNSVLAFIKALSNNENNKVSIILFGSNARTKYLARPINSIFEIDFMNGGTNFDHAFQ